MSEEALLEGLRETIATIDPVPRGIRVSGHGAFWMADALRRSRLHPGLLEVVEDYRVRGGADDVA
jgi:hypothetical protein